jgi:hypothetical protein
MIRVIENTVNYFRPKRDDFWRWGDSAGAIEWGDSGATICFKHDLAFILRQFPEDRLPRLGSLLLVMYACNNETGVREQFALRRMFEKERREQLGRVSSAVTFLNLIHSLPPSFRSGNKRLVLIREIFEDNSYARDSSVSISLNELQSGRLDAQLMNPEGYIELADIMADLNCLIRASERFPTYESLELFLKTGVDVLPEPLSIEVPEEKHSNDHVDEFLNDTETAGVSRLARRLLSVIHIPIHARAGGEDSYGGIADITNRGNYDRLLLSELAQDELLLTARLVNNEALYFRREEPPAQPKNHRIILIDSTIKMWGIPRVFAIASALAFLQNSKHGERVEAYVLKESTYEQISLNDKDGVIDALSKLHPALHPGKALEQAVRELSDGDDTEFILITESRQLKHTGFYASFFKVKERISFVITVEREGGIRFAEYSNGHAKVLNEAKLDITEILKGEEKKIPMFGKTQKVSEEVDKGDFKFFDDFPLPLLFLKRNISLDNRVAFGDPKGLAIVIDRAKRVLLLQSGSKGAMEFIDAIENGEYYFNRAHPLGWNILVRSIAGKSLLKLYTINLGGMKTHTHDLLPEIMGEITDAVFAKDGFLYLFSEFVIYQYDYLSTKLVEKKQYASVKEVGEVKQSLARPDRKSSSGLHGLMKSPNYQLLFSASNVFINGKQELVWGNFALTLDESAEKLTFYDRSDYNRLVMARLSPETFFEGSKVKCRKAVFPDGSVALMDKRGVLHLKSSNKDLPQVALIAITHRPISGWSSTGYFCGARFFIDESNEPSVMPVNEFYKQYIRPFIDHILDHEVSIGI